MSQRMCLSGPLRMVTTIFLKQAGETVGEGKYPITLFITSIGVANGIILSNKVMVGKRQSLSTLPSRMMMYFMSNGHSEFHQIFFVESNQESDIRS